MKRLSPANLVLAVSLGALAVVTLIFGLLVWQAYYQVIAQGESRARTAAEVVGQQTKLAIGSSFAWMADLAYVISGEPASLAQAEEVVARLPGTGLLSQTGVAGYDGAGKLVYASPRSDHVPTDVSQMEFFAQIASGQPRATSFSAGRDGGTILVLAIGLQKDGVPSGVLALFVDDDLLAAFAKPLELGPQSTVSLVRLDGWVLARSPPLTAPINVGNVAALEGEQGAYNASSSPADGIARIVGYQRVSDLGVMAIASLGRDQVLGGLWTSTLIVTLLLAPIALGLLAVALLAARLLRQAAHSQAVLQSAVDRNELLFREIHHRVKNNLQSVAALFQLHPIDPVIKAAMSQRIGALAAVHEHIYSRDPFDRVPLRAYLHDLIAGIRSGHGTTIRVVESIEDIGLPRDKAMPLGLLVNEVMTNAFKHAFPTGTTGEMSVAFSKSSEGTGELVISDSGRGFNANTSGPGIGRRLIKAFVGQLGGTLDVSSNHGGTRYAVAFPVSDE